MMVRAFISRSFIHRAEAPRALCRGMEALTLLYVTMNFYRCAAMNVLYIAMTIEGMYIKVSCKLEPERTLGNY